MNKTQQNALIQRYEDLYGMARAELRATKQALINARCELDLTKKALTYARLPWWRRMWKGQEDG